MIISQEGTKARGWRGLQELPCLHCKFYPKVDFHGDFEECCLQKRVFLIVLNLAFQALFLHTEFVGVLSKEWCIALKGLHPHDTGL